VRKITEEAYAKLRAAGANLVEVHLDTLLDLNKDDRLSAPRGNTRQIFADWVAKNLPGVTLEQIYDPLLGSSGPGGSGRPNPATVTAEQHAQMLTAARRTYADFFKQHGLFAISFPTLLFPAPLENVHGDTPGQKILVGGKWVDEYDHIIINLFWNARLGVPGISLPSGMTNGLPVGLEFDSMIGEDSRLLGLGMSAENVLGVLPPPPIIGNA
jgi:Asp-tRNA(Asn)/Glu-tRNA(Gln) amidotransferase A subunit family amidase